ENAGSGLRRVGRERLGRPIVAGKPAAAFHQSITYRRISVTAYEAKLAEPPPPGWELPPHARWLTTRRIARLPHGSSTARLLALLGSPLPSESRHGGKRRKARA